MTTPLTEEQLAAWEREHTDDGMGWCIVCARIMPCPATLLVAKVRRLTLSLEVEHDAMLDQVGRAKNAERDRDNAERERDEARQGEKDACAITGRLARELGEEHAARKGAEREAEAARAVVEAAKGFTNHACECGILPVGRKCCVCHLREALAAFRAASGKGEG